MRGKKEQGGEARQSNLGWLCRDRAGVGGDAPGDARSPARPQAPRIWGRAAAASPRSPPTPLRGFSLSPTTSKWCWAKACNCTICSNYPAEVIGLREALGRLQLRASPAAAERCRRNGGTPGLRGHPRAAGTPESCGDTPRPREHPKAPGYPKAAGTPQGFGAEAPQISETEPLAAGVPGRCCK